MTGVSFADTSIVTEGSESGMTFNPSDRETFIVAARNALSVASTSLFILQREIPETARSQKVSKHLARIERHLTTLARLMGVESFT